MRTPGFVAEKSFYRAISDRPLHSFAAGIADPAEAIGPRGEIFPQARMEMHCYLKRGWLWGESWVCVCNEYEKNEYGDWVRTKSYMC